MHGEGARSFVSDFNGWNTNNTVTDHDMAVLRLYEPIGSRIPVLHHDDDGEAKELEHHGGATGGDSGGPFFAFWDGGPYSIGTTSGGETEAGARTTMSRPGAKPWSTSRSGH